MDGWVRSYVWRFDLSHIRGLLYRGTADHTADMPDIFRHTICGSTGLPYRPANPVIEIPLMNCFWNIKKTVNMGMVIKVANAIV